MKKLVFIQSNPIQYFAPLYKYLTEQGIDVEVWFCSSAGVKDYIDDGFGVKLKWNIPLLGGYKYKFYKNYSPSFFRGTFLQYMNFGLFFDLLKAKNTVFVIPGWQYFVYLMADIVGSLGGKEMVLRFETPLNQVSFESLLGKLKESFLRWYLNLNQYFFYVGRQNKLFIEHFVSDRSKLIFSPYSVDNDRFGQEYENRRSKKCKIRESLGISETGVVVLYSGKYISKKRPMDLLLASLQFVNMNVWFVFMGEGELRTQMEQFIADNGLTNVILTGFVNQDKVSDYYVSADIFVMCSGVGETWGLAVNEAMNFELPILVYDLVGCSSDLVVDGENGYIVPYSNYRALSERIEDLVNNLEFRCQAGLESKKIVSDFSFRQIYEGFRKVLLTE